MISYRFRANIEVTKNQMTRVLLSDAGFETKTGEIIIVKASNGSGKSSFIKALLGSINDFNVNTKKSFRKNFVGDGGIKADVFIEEINYQLKTSKRINASQFAEITSYMKQSYPNILLNGTIDDFIKENIRGSINDSKITELYLDKKFVRLKNSLIHLFYYEPDFSYEKFKPSDKINKMSGGELQVLFFIAAIIRGIFTKFIILDEPFNNVGYRQKRIIHDLIQKIHEDLTDKIILIVSHCTIININNYKISKAITIDEENKKFVNADYSSLSCLGTAQNKYFDFVNHIEKENIFFGGIGHVKES